MLRGRALVAIAICAGVAAADPLGDAKTQVSNSEYLKAGASLDAAYASGTNNPDQLAEIWRLRGIVAGALGDTKSSTDAFQKCLVLAPNADLPPGTSPKIMRPFQAAQKAANAPLKIKQTTTEEPPSVSVAIASDPMSMIAQIVVDVRVNGGATQKLEKKFAGQDAIEFALPAGGRLDLQIAALDEKGNRLAELGSADVPIVIVGKQAQQVVVAKPLAKPKQPPQPVHERPLIWKWWLWGGAAVVVGGVATGFGIDGLLAKRDLEHMNRESPNHRFTEAQALERRARRDFLISNITFPVAGALAVTATILFLTDPGKPTERRVTAVPIEGGGAVVFGGHF
jgi:hypothetical protein